MKKIILTGAGGCMRELLWQIQICNQVNPTWEVLGFADICDQQKEVEVGGIAYPYLGDDDALLRRREETQVVICAGSSRLRKKIATKLKQNPQIYFPNLILPDTRICPDVQMGEGNIISMDCRISTNVSLGSFVFLNLGAVVCHDGCLADFVTLSPAVRLAGAVTIGAGSELGMGAKVIQGVQIGTEAVVGAGGVVIRNLPDGCTAVGVPAREQTGGSGRNSVFQQGNARSMRDGRGSFREE